MMDDLAMDGAYEKRDTRPGLIICVFDDPHPEWDLVEDLSGRLWDPPGGSHGVCALRSTPATG
jgi:hypothetical protein